MRDCGMLMIKTAAKAISSDYLRAVATMDFDFNPRTRVDGDERQIFDLVRKGWFVLTPEEFVRQYYISLLSQELDYPISWMKCEVEVKGSGPIKRADLIIHERSGNPWVVCEFKAMNVPINEETVFQAARYNRDLGAPFVLIANGKEQCLIELDMEFGNHKTRAELPSRAELESVSSMQKSD